MGFRREIVFKYLAGRFSLNEKKMVDEYFVNNNYAHELDNTLENHWEELTGRGIQTGKDLDHLLDKVIHQIHVQSVKPAGRFIRTWQVWSRIAAILLLPVFILSVYYFLHTWNNNIPSWVEVHSPNGGRVQFSLPDGSTGWLNGGSEIRYPAQFGAKRTVVMNGEAFFDVMKNPAAPFCVYAKGLKIKVLGTSFNVVAYDQDSITEVTVASGKVEVKGEGNHFNQKLLSSEHLVINRLRNQVTRSVVDIENYTSWRSGKLVFKNDNLNEVIRKISRFYNVDFEVDGNVERNQLFRAILEDESLPEILRYMKLTMPINYTIQERDQHPDGTISRRKIRITNAVN